jgi:hypothetical protein
MEDEVRADLAPHVSDPASLDPFGLRRSVWRAVAEVSELTDCLHKGRNLSLVADTQRYCPEGLRRVTGVAWKNSSGNWSGDVSVRTQHWMDAHIYDWRNEPAADTARALVVTGPSTILVWPTPSVSRAAGLRFEGYWKPGEKWEYDVDGNLTAAARADDCPIPDFAQPAAVMRAKYLFAVQLLTKEPAIKPYMEVLRAESLSMVGIVESDSANHWQAMGGAPISLWRS